MYKFKYTADVINWLLAFNSKPGLQTLDLDSQFLHLTWPEINSFVRDTEFIADFFSSYYYVQLLILDNMQWM